MKGFFFFRSLKNWGRKKVGISAEKEGFACRIFLTYFTGKKILLIWLINLKQNFSFFHFFILLLTFYNWRRIEWDFLSSSGQCYFNLNPISSDLSETSHRFSFKFNLLKLYFSLRYCSLLLRQFIVNLIAKILTLIFASWIAKKGLQESFLFNPTIKKKCFVTQTLELMLYSWFLEMIELPHVLLREV